MKDRRNLIIIFLAIVAITVAAAEFMFLRYHPLFKNAADENKKKENPGIMYVTPFSGVVLRKGPGVTAGKIETITYSAPVEILEKSAITETISGHEGTWVRVKWNRNYYFHRATPDYREGWCFSGFLSAEETPFRVPQGVTVGTPPRTGRYEEVYMDMVSSLDDPPTGMQSTISLILSDDGTIQYEEYSELEDCDQFLRKKGTYRIQGYIAKAVYKKRECNFNDSERSVDRDDIDEEKDYLFCETADKYLVTDGGRLFFDRK